MLPFGTLINQKYQSLNQINRNIRKNENNLQNDLKLMINEFICRSKDGEIIFGTINTDQSLCNQKLIENCLIIIKLKNIESLNLVLAPNSVINNSRLEIRPDLQLNALHVINYKCSSATIPMKTFLDYNYNINQIANQKNLFKIQLTLNLKNSIHFKFNYFNIQFKLSDNISLSPIRSNLTFGQLRHESIGLFWIIGTKFPKSGQIKLNFEIFCLNNKLSELETICNFKIENFQTSLSFAESEHLTIDDLTVNTNSKLPIIIDSTLTSIDYKLFPELN